MTWGLFEKLWWLFFSVVVVLLGAWWRLAITVHKSKERLAQVAENKKAIDALKEEMTGIKDDISDIKGNVNRQTEDTAAMLSLLQAITIALNDKDCNIGPARDRFNEHLAKR